MGWLILVATMIAGVFISSYMVMRKEVLYTPKLVPPVWAGPETEQLYKRFNHAWNTSIENNINERIKNSNHSLTAAEIRDRLSELKKFLLLASISKGLPMFSQKVDEVWHFFLEEKELYRDFCYQFTGGLIEHYPHEKLKHLPKERAWFDILYLSFFPVSSSSKLWADFLQKREEHVQWMERLSKNTGEIKADYRRQDGNAPTAETLDDFLMFAKEQLHPQEYELSKRVPQVDGYWYAPAMFGFAAYEFHQEQKKRNDNGSGDGGAAGTASVDDERENDWNDIASSVNSFDAGSDNNSVSISDSGSSCSSCSSCSGCSS